LYLIKYKIYYVTKGVCLYLHLYGLQRKCHIQPNNTSTLKGYNKVHIPSPKCSTVYFKSVRVETVHR